MDAKTENLVIVGVGALAAVFGAKMAGKWSWAIQALGVGAAAIGGYQYFTGQQILPKFSGFGAWERPHGSYATDLSQLPYDPNNYFLPPREF